MGIPFLSLRMKEKRIHFVLFLSLSREKKEFNFLTLNEIYFVNVDFPTHAMPILTALEHSAYIATNNTQVCK